MLHDHFGAIVVLYSINVSHPNDLSCIPKSYIRLGKDIMGLSAIFTPNSSR